MKQFLILICLIISAFLTLVIISGCSGNVNNSDLKECSSDKECIKSGCSATLCLPSKAEPVFTTCEYKPEYECYKNIPCGCENSKCLWKTDSAFEKCVEDKRKEESVNELVPIV